MNVFNRIFRLNLEELAPLTDTLPASPSPAVGRSLRFKLTEVASRDAPLATAPSRDATSRLRPRTTDPGEAAEIMEDSPDDVPPVMDEAFTESVLAIATHLFDSTRRPLVPPPGPARAAAPVSMSMRNCIDTAQLVCPG